MRISSYSRLFHDPHGSRRLGKNGSVTGRQYMVGAGSLQSVPAQSGIPYEAANVSKRVGYMDRVSRWERNATKFVRTGKSCVERLRR